jgi:hypothetical protein
MIDATSLKAVADYLNPFSLTLSLALVLAVALHLKFSFKDKILIGRVWRLFPFYVDLREAKHIVIFGITGSGKTNTAKLIVSSFRGSKLIIDWNGEYLIGRVAKPSKLSISHLTMLDFCEALAVSLQLTAPQYAMLLEVAKDSSNLSEIIEKLRKYPAESDTRREIKNALLRRLEPLSYANLFSGSLTLDDVDTIDLSGLTFDAKRLVVNVILRLIYNNPTKQLLVIEEAQNVLLPRRLDQPPTSCEIIIDEVRKHGVRVLAIAQIPSLVSTTYRNAEYIILHRLSLTAEEAKNMGLTEDERLKIAKLPNGSCVVVHRGQKFTVRVFKAKSPSTGALSEKARAEAQEREDRSPSEPKSETALLPYIIEDLKEISEWRKGVTNNVDRLAREVDELKQLLKNFVDKLSFLSNVETATPSDIKALRDKIESLEYSLSFVRERVSEIEEALYKSSKGGELHGKCSKAN